MLPDGSKAKLVQTTKDGQIRVSKSSLGHVEIFPMGGVGTSIMGRPRLLSAQRRDRYAHLNYTLNCEEPLFWWPARWGLSSDTHRPPISGAE
ncbi:hypothetical protein E3T47_00800 [Cryobacterium ruanii]|uniref:Uncharacterized protein n=1 Tax=Cryobacterium ruanii TaxID=1259197 RepID=A0A4R9ATJ7_9MICO|nr:hypothetical protein E3T47_00800 [Cryobacterium ruanii]